MCQLFETIAIVDNVAQNIEYHQARFERSYKELWGINPSIELKDYIKFNGIYKLCRAKFIYSKNNFGTEYHQYIPKQIKFLKVVEDNDIDYHLKYLRRDAINSLFFQKEECDDILIVKNSLVCDISIANIYFYDGEKWITPKTPLLKGTCRERVMKELNIVEQDIEIYGIEKYEKIAISNAMRGFDIIDCRVVL